MAEAVTEDPPPEEPPPPAEEPVEPMPAPVAHEPPFEPEPIVDEVPLTALERLAAPIETSADLRRRDRFLTAAWAASFAALAAMGVAGYTERDRLMREWPASKRVYTTLGLAPAAAGNATGRTESSTRP